MKITYYGHSCVGVEVAGKHLLFDPFITPNELAKHIDVNKVPADYILLSHGHQDHVADVELIAKNTGAKVVGVFEVVSWFTEKGIKNGMGMNTGGIAALESGITIKMVNAVHSSSLPDGSYGGNPVGFVVTTPEGNFYFAGDTALTMDMQLIPDYAKIDIAMLPIGDFFTMGVQDAITAAKFVKTDKVIGLHYNTFPPISIDTEAAISNFKDADITLSLPQIGLAKSY
ncbi:metal-dependent hydrolase [Limibacter armeniacum]|uniref:metal-dependent hydrolase n=1 Tax=Limibacter armeniacum TaxID=466084 RepID=UPI002FE660B9